MAFRAPSITAWRRSPRAKPRLLIVRHRRYQRRFFDVILKWVAANVPELTPLFDVRELPTPIRDWSPFVLHVPWLQDPVQEWSPETYDQACELAAACDARGIPVLNRVDRLLNATKSRGAALMQAAGVATPRMERIDDPREFRDARRGLSFPLFIRDDWGHSRNLVRIDGPADLDRVPWRDYQRPLAVQIVDVCDPRDGLHRKYRYFAAGDVGVSHHLQTSTEWITRGENRVMTPESRAEELAYITRPDPNHAALQAARRALGLDMIAFDYGYARDGRMIVWEANPFPTIVFGARRLVYRNPAIHRTLAAIVRLYLAAAGLPIPAKIDDALAADFPAIESRFTCDFPLTFYERWRGWPFRHKRAA
jgi:hypothetical protein